MRVELTISVYDLNPAVVAACQAVGLTSFNRSILECGSEAVVSPANSFGFMDGGVDWIYTQHFGQHIEDHAKAAAANDGGEVLVGRAHALLTDREPIRYVIMAPTMRVPRRILDPMDIALATRAAIRCAMDHDITSIAFPGMGTGCGMIRPDFAATAMATGVRMALSPPAPPISWREAQAAHFQLRG